MTDRDPGRAHHQNRDAGADPLRPQCRAGPDLLGREMETIPEVLRNSVTWDQGKEMARHADFTVRTGMPVYFCDPHSPWQRGSNENTNGLLRQYFPKGTGLSLHSQEELDRVTAELNGRPRRTLSWREPIKVFNVCCQALCPHDHLNPPSMSATCATPLRSWNEVTNTPRLASLQVAGSNNAPNIQVISFRLLTPRSFPLADGGHGRCLQAAE